MVNYIIKNNDSIFHSFFFTKVVGSHFAWATRNVHISALNDSTYVGMSLYNVVLLSTTTAVVGYFLRDQHERSYILTSIFILLCVTITLCLVFVPKVLEVAKDPRSRARPPRATLIKGKSKAPDNHEHTKLLTQIKTLTKQNEILRSNAMKVCLFTINVFSPIAIILL